MTNRNDWGLTEWGFRRPSYEEILDAFESQAREKFQRSGRYPDLTVRSPLGIFLRIWAWIVGLLFQVLEDVYNSQFIDTAVGSSLFQLGRILGLQLLPSQRSGGYIEIDGTPGSIVPEGLLVGTGSGIQFVVMLTGVIDKNGKALLPVQCTEYGEIGNVAVHRINQVITPIAGVDSVINPSETSGGRARETSEQFRDRYYKSVDFAGGVNADGIRAEILQNVEGVLAAIVYENDTDEYNAMGLPPHSIEAVIFAGLDHQIAQAIYRRKAAGIQTHGSSMVPVISPTSGQVFKIRFTRPVGIPVWIRVSNVRVEVSSLPSDAEEKIKQALIGYIGSDVTNGISIGEDVVFNKLPCRIFSVPGIIDFSMSISRDGQMYAKENILIGERQKAITNAQMIDVALELLGEEGRL